MLWKINPAARILDNLSYATALVNFSKIKSIMRRIDFCGFVVIYYFHLRLVIKNNPERA